MAILDLKDNREKAFAEFLYRRFGKPAHEITKEELLSNLINTDFENPQWKATAFGSAASIYSWYGCHFKGTNTKFAILRDLGYADRLNITEKEVKEAASARTGASKTLHGSLENTSAIFLAFFDNIYGKGARITKKRLVAIGKNAYANKKYCSTPAGNAHGLFMHYARAYGTAGVHFHILSDLGLAAKYKISEKEIKEAAARRIVSGRASQYSSKSKRQQLFAEFLRAHFEKPAINVSKEELLRLRDSDLLSAPRKFKNGSIATFYCWYQHHFKGTLALFAILKDLGYAERLGITKEEAELAVFDKMSKSISAASTGKNRKVVIKPQQSICKGSRKNVLVPPNIITLPGRQTGAIEIIMSTTRSVGSQGPASQPVSMLPPIVQAIMLHFKVSDVTRDSRPLEKLAQAPLGFTTVITSQYPLDEIYKKGISDTGYEILDENVTFRSGAREVDKSLKGWHATRIRRTELLSNATSLMFKNDYRPDKTALHILGEFSRKLKDAQTPGEVSLIQSSAITWLFTIREGRIIEPDRMRYVEERYGAELLKAVQRRIGELLEQGHANATQRMAVAAAVHNDASARQFWRILPLLGKLNVFSNRAAALQTGQRRPTDDLAAKHSIMQASRTRALEATLSRKFTTSQARVAAAQQRELLLH